MIAAGLLLLLGSAVVGQGPPVVEPARLAKDPDLVGREVVVDDRVRFFQAHRKGGKEVFDELLLKRTEVVFKLPPGLRPDRPPRQPSARVRGVLRSDGRTLTCEVLALEMLPPDLDRVDREVKRLGADDSAGRIAWATWAERRGRDFKDADLSARGKALEADALLIEAHRPGADSLALARRARSRDLPDDLTSALFHRGLRPLVDRGGSAEELGKLAAEIATALPRSTDPKAPAPGEGWSGRVKADPLAAYPQAPPEVRAGLDRTLLADAIQGRLERRLADAPGEAFALAEEAKASLPDRPDVSGRLRDRGLSATEANVAGMRLSEVETLAATFRADGQDGRAKALLRAWLDDQRRRLNASDPDGHILLAGQYARLLDDRASAATLLNDALKTDPGSKAAAAAFRRMNFRKSPEGHWFDPAAGPDASRASAPESAPAARASADTLRGMTVEQVRARLGGKPDRISRSATQDETIEQWTYQGPRGTQVVNIRRTRGRSRPEVISSYTIP